MSAPDAPGQDASQPETSPPETSQPETSEPHASESDWERKARLARIFGEVLPASTSDDRDEPSSRESGTDAWLKAQVPPHHGS